MTGVRLPLAARLVTRGPRHHFFGYYDKSPWDSAQRRLLALATTFMDRPPGPDDVALIGLVDLERDCAWEPVAETRAWNWQQGTMLRWLPGAEGREIIFNDRQEGQFVSVVLNLDTGRRRVFPLPVYALSPDGRFGVTPNFSRIFRYRPGYGYAGVEDPSVEEPAPEDDGIFRLDLTTGDCMQIISLAEVAARQPDERMAGAAHWFNHLQFSPSGHRFIFLHRWRLPSQGWFTRLYTARPDGSDLCLLADDDLVSHFDWYGSDYVLAWARVRERGDHFFLFPDRGGEPQVLGPEVLTEDGHCSFSPDRRWLLTDTYPDAEDMRTLILFHPASGERFDLGHFYAPPELEGEIRCDLHPRWSPDGRQVCFDSAHEGRRGMYVVDVGPLVERLL